MQTNEIVNQLLVELAALREASTVDQPGGAPLTNATRQAEIVAQLRALGHDPGEEAGEPPR